MRAQVFEVLADESFVRVSAINPSSNYCYISLLYDGADCNYRWRVVGLYQGNGCVP